MRHVLRGVVSGPSLSCRFLLGAGILLSSTVACLAQGAGYWHTSGNQILDSTNTPVRIAGINWYGFETTDEVAHGLYAQDYHTILKTIHAEGYNTIRLPYSNQMVESPIIPTGVQMANAAGPINTDLAGLNSLQILDKIIAAAGAEELKVILVNHRSEAGNSNEPNGLWYTAAYPETSWIADWQTLVTRYKSIKDANGNPIVIGVDLRNEPHLLAQTGRTGSCWTGDTWSNGCPMTNTAQNWPAAAQRAAKAVLAADSNLLIFVEGTDCYSGDCGWQGANLEGAGKYPVMLPVRNRLVYSAHDYGPDLSAQSWFNSATTATSLKSAWTKYWAYLSINGTAPVWLGEFGTTNSAADIKNTSAGSQGQWFETLVSFLQNEPNIQWTYWALNGEDSFALLDGNYDAIPLNSTKQQMLASIEFPLKGLNGTGKPPVPCSTTPGAPTGLVAATYSSSSILVSWNAVTPPANCQVTYTVYRSIVSGFLASSNYQVASGLKSPAFTDTGLAPGTTFYYIVRSVDSHASSVSSATASAKTTKAVAGTACHVTYTVTSSWAGGFQASVAIQNTGMASMTSWTLSWTFPNGQQLTSFWNGNASQSGKIVTATSESYNGTIAPGATVSGMGLTANVTGTNSAPTSFVVNGVSCR